MLVLWTIGFLTILAFRAALLFRPRRRSGGLAAEVIAIPDVEIEEAALGGSAGEGGVDRGLHAEIEVAGAGLAEPDGERPAPRLIGDAADGGGLDLGNGRIALHARKNRDHAARVPVASEELGKRQICHQWRVVGADAASGLRGDGREVGCRQHVVDERDKLIRISKTHSSAMASRREIITLKKKQMVRSSCAILS